MVRLIFFANKTVFEIEVSVILEQKHGEAAASHANQANGQVVKLPDAKKSRRPSFNRQSSQDSQNSGKRRPLIFIIA